MILQPIIPWWALGIVFAPFVGFIIWRLMRERRYWLWMRRLVIVALMVFISLRPAVPGGLASGGTGLLDVYFVIDTTTSMTAQDYNGTLPRLDGVRHDVAAIVKELAGARFGVITFDNSVQIQLPLTNDATASVSAVETTLAQTIFYGTGSTIDAPVEKLHTELERVAKKTPDRGRIVFYFGDGEQTRQETPGSFASIAPLIAGGAVLGYGTSAGGKMPDEFSIKYGGDPYVKDYSAKTYPVPDALSVIDEGNLQTIARQMGVGYVHRDQPNSIESVIGDINVGRVIQNSREVESYTDLYWIGAIGLAALLAMEVWPIYRAAHQLHRLDKKGTKQ